MTPKFSAAVDPVFEYVGDLLERIDRQERVSPAEEHNTISSWINLAETKIGQSEEWQLAKYALACWIDEVLVEAKWDGSGWWTNHGLEFELFQTQERYWLFYVKAREAGGLPHREALEVYYLCVILGFRGLYANPESAEAEAETHRLPPRFHDWIDQTAGMIRERPIPPLTITPNRPPGAPPRASQVKAVAAWIFATVLGMFLLITWWVTKN